MSERERSLSPAESEFFREFFRRLAAGGVASVLLRNYEGFPARMGHDLDVFFRRADLARAVEIFRGALRASGGEVLHVHARDYFLAVWFRAHPGASPAIHLDFYHGAFTWHGLPYLSEQELSAGSRPFQQFRVPRPAHEALNLFLTSLLWGGFFKARYGDRIRSLLQPPGEKTEFFRLLKREFGKAALRAFSLADQPPPPREEEEAHSRHLRRAFRIRSLARRPLATAFRSSRFWLRELATVFSPPGFVLSVLGPDGSGKSTVIHAVKERLADFFGETVEYHWRPSLLPDVGVLLGKRVRNTGPVTDPHGRPPHSQAASLVRLFYYWLDYWLGYPGRVRKPKAKNHLVIFDRYAQDIWCDPRRYRLSLPDGLTRWLCRLVPQPDLIFVLLADAEVIHRRKGEVPLETLRELLRRYAGTAEQGGHVRAVDCGPPADQVAEQIAGAVLDCLKVKAAKHPFFQ